MTIIVWDRKTLAADKQATSGGLRRMVTKIRNINGMLCGVSGDWDRAQMMFEWVSDGMQVSKWPEFQKTGDDWVGLLVIKSGGATYKYERAPVPMLVEDDFFAMGSGRDYAYGAMSMGADAVEAVRVTSLYDVGCGMGIDTLRLGVAM